MELGFFHPSRGYWQAVDGDRDELLAVYPAGTIEVPLKPGADFEWQNGVWGHVEPSVDLLAYASQKRWEVETGGITVNGTEIRTDEKSQSRITGAFSLLNADPTLTTIDWEAQPGMWVTVDAATMKVIGIAVGRHVQACFSTLKAVQAAINAGTVTTAAEIDDEFTAAVVL